MRKLTEMQAFLLLLMREANGDTHGTIYIAGHVSLTAQIFTLARITERVHSPLDLHAFSVMGKLDRLVSAGFCTAKRIYNTGGWFTITDLGRRQLDEDQPTIKVMIDRYAARQALWNRQRGQ